MHEFQVELHLAKSSVIAALDTLKTLKPELSFFGLDFAVPKEMKAAPDKILEELILSRLCSSGLNILSEEIGLIELGNEKNLHWIIDPLDGTVNFIRGLGACSVSLALYMDAMPIFGVVGEFPSGKLIWGGKQFGSFDDDRPIQTSNISSKAQSVICSGFPSRFQFSSENLIWISKTLSSYAKVRMLGSASLSLIQVARGAADAYSERNIMLWDVAAGLAILQGAGGYYSMQAADAAYSFNVFASNGKISET